MKLVRRAAALAAMLAFASAPSFAADDIVSTADKAGSFKTLITAVKQAGLEETLKGKGPYTVFAPTDDAFKKLPAGALDTLMKPENKAQLAAVLKYHVLKGAYPAERLNKAKAREYTVKTVEGGTVLFNKKGGLTIGGNKIAKADIGASNGTIHVIDAVLLPASVKKTIAKATAPVPAPKQAKAPAAAPKKAEPAKPAAEPAKAPAAKTEAPKADAAKAAPAKADAPKAEAPKAEAPKAEAPKADAAKAAPTKADAPKAEAPKADAPKADAAKADAKPSTPAAATQPAAPAPAKK